MKPPSEIQAQGFWGEEGRVVVVAEGLRDVVVCILMLLCVSLPLFLGGAHPLGTLWMHTLGACALLLWVGTLILERRRPALPGWLGACLVAGLALGWTGAWNAAFVFKGAHQGFEARDFQRWLPSAVDGTLASNALRHGTLLCGLFLSVADLCAHARHRRRLFFGLFLAGLLQLLLGIVQKLCNASSVFGFGLGEGLPFFGAFLYSGCAGAFINLALPAFFLPARQIRMSRLRTALGVGAGLLAVLWNTSRIAATVALGMAACVGLCAVVQHFWGGGRGRSRSLIGDSWREKRRWPIVLAVLVLGGMALAVFPIPPLFEKWQRFSGQLHSQNPRLESFKVAFQMLGDAGPWGMGPGTFGAVFPHYAHELGAAGIGFWRHAHCDYLEWLVEWGWAGTVLWSVVPIGALWRLLVHLRLAPDKRDRLEALCALFALGSVSIHAIADFPLHNPSIQLAAVVWLGGAWSFSRNCDREKSVPCKVQCKRAVSRGESLRRDGFRVSVRL